MTYVSLLFSKGCGKEKIINHLFHGFDCLCSVWNLISSGW